MKNQTDIRSSKGGRPAKFNEPSRVVTLTLPERTLDRLSTIDDDRAKAIVKATNAFFSAEETTDTDPVCELTIDKNRSLISVPNCRQLRSIPWLTLIEISPGRYLLSIRSGIPIEKLEVTIVDFLDEKANITESERNILNSLLRHLRIPRRNHTVQKEEILVIDKT